MNRVKKAIIQGLDKAARFLARGYDGGEENRNRGNIPWDRQTNQDEDRYLTGATRDLLRQKLMNHRRNNPIVKGLCDRMCDFVVGPYGLQVQAQTDNDAWNKEAEAWFKDWQRRADVTGRWPFRKGQRAMVDARLWAGESFPMFTPQGQLQFIEAERIRNPQGEVETATRYDGMNLSGPVVTSWYVADRDETGTFGKNMGRWVDAQSVYHFGSPWRFDSIRALPELAAGVNVITDIGEISLFTLTQIKKQAMIAGVMTSEGAADMFARRGSAAVVSGSTGMQATKVDDFGIVLRGQPGESFTPTQPASPNPGLESHLVFNLRQFCACSGIPYEVALMDSTRGNLSQNKAVRELFARVVEGWQLDVSDFVRYVWSWRIPMAWKNKEISPAPIINGRSQWDKIAIQFPPATWADPQDAADTDAKNITMGSDSHSGVIARRGGDIADVWEQKAKDEQLRQKLAKQYGVDPDAISRIQVAGAAPAPAGKESSNEK